MLHVHRSLGFTFSKSSIWVIDFGLFFVGKKIGSVSWASTFRLNAYCKRIGNLYDAYAYIVEQCVTFL